MQLGCGGGGPGSKVVVGLTDSMRARVTSWVKMEKGTANPPPFPQSGRPSYTQALVAGHYSLTRSGVTPYDFDAPTILDTGGGTTDIHQADALKVPEALLNADKKSVLTGTRFSLTAPSAVGGSGLDMSFNTGTTSTIDLVNVSQAKPPAPGDKPKAEVNVGLVPFFRYDVVYDVERGNVGFAPCTSALPPPTAPIPTLSTWTMGALALVLASLGALAAKVRRRRP